MMSKKSPQLRFEGFTDDWEERKLKDYVGPVISDGDWIEKEHIHDSGVYRIIQTGNLGLGEFHDKSSSAKYMNEESFNILNANEIFPNDILISRLADPAGRTIILPDTKNKMVTAVDVTIIRPNKLFDSYFFITEMNSTVVLNKISKSVSGTSHKRISRRNLEMISLLIPSLEEQQKIGSFFKQLDDTIALHQRKLDLLKEQKKGFLQKMFPKNGAKVPELRFAGFADDWEERKLGEVFNQTVEYINPNEANLELWSVTVERGLTPKTARYNREALVKKNDKFKVVHDGDIVYNPMNLTIGAVGFNKSEKSVAVSGYYVTMNMNSGFNNSYFQTWLKSENAIKQYKLYATGSLIEKQRVQFPTLSLIKSYIPTFEEQQKIGSFFKQLDETIALHQRKLDLLKEQKKGFLQKMFV
ncbi:restriction endonuclease subunit S [Lactococcus lactis]|uniref:restriction endonuclease subunit S n=1 Tax=Lactococcus lactis TaxID=1358 RepID=UPI00109C0C91|nr:restriction endonuclease subunit S [Lactococcus lactis]